MDSQFINIAAYKFTPLTNLDGLRRDLLQKTREIGMKGTILLSDEGVNLFVAAERESIDQFLDYMGKTHPAFADLTVKESLSDYQPFSRMLVRVKKEIISMGVPDIAPASKTSPKIAAAELKQWLDEGRDVALLDVRNDYEVDLGTFDDAIPIGIDHFRKFPEAVASLPSELKTKPVVMFCTGGIRCEKAGPLMEERGFEHVYQLDGGILKYFEDCGGEHYHGECFVFDKRVALDPQLNETGTTQCYACQAIVTLADQQSEHYVAGKSCPRCYRTDEEQMAMLIEMRNEQIRSIANPLPGKAPYDNVRPINVPLRFDQHSVLDFLDGQHPHLGRDYWESECREGRIVYKESPVEPERQVRSGWRIEHLLPQTVEPDVNADIQLLHEDDCLIVVNKPAPLPMHPCGRFNRNSLTYILSQIYTGQRLRIAHRLDANTTGVVVICRKRAAADWMRNQFEAGKVGKTYLAKVFGHPDSERFDCCAPIGEKPSQAGHRVVDPNGLSAETEFRVLRRNDDGTALLECSPKTGRTNQIRIHLWHLGHSIVGDLSYLPNGMIQEGQTKSIEDEPMFLHAWKLYFDHPVSKKRVEFSAPPRPSFQVDC